MTDHSITGSKAGSRDRVMLTSEEAAKVEADYAIMGKDYVDTVEEILKGGNVRDVRNAILIKPDGVSGRKETIKGLQNVYAAVQVLRGYQASIDERIQVSQAAEIQELRKYKDVIDMNMGYLLRGEYVLISHINMVDSTDCVEDLSKTNFDDLSEDVIECRKDMAETIHDQNNLKEEVRELRVEVQDLGRQLNTAFRLIDELKTGIKAEPGIQQPVATPVSKPAVPTPVSKYPPPLTSGVSGFNLTSFKQSLSESPQGPPAKSLKAGSGPPTKGFNALALESVTGSGSSGSQGPVSTDPKAAVEAKPAIEVKPKPATPKVEAKAAGPGVQNFVSKTEARDLILLQGNEVRVYDHTRSGFNIWRGYHETHLIEVAGRLKSILPCSHPRTSDLKGVRADGSKFDLSNSTVKCKGLPRDMDEVDLIDNLFTFGRLLPHDHLNTAVVGCKFQYDREPGTDLSHFNGIILIQFASRDLAECFNHFVNDSQPFIDECLGQKFYRCLSDFNEFPLGRDGSPAGVVRGHVRRFNENVFNPHPRVFYDLRQPTVAGGELEVHKRRVPLGLTPPPNLAPGYGGGANSPMNLNVH